MQVSYSKNGYKDYGKDDTTVLKGTFKDFNGIEINPSLACFNQHSIIQNFFGIFANEFYLSKTIDKLDINKKKDFKPFKMSNALNGNDFIDLNYLEFLKYLEYHKNNPALACISNDNDTKYFRLYNRFENNNKNMVELSNLLDNYKGSGVFLTLTYNHKKSLVDTWLNLLDDWNVFNTRLVEEITINHYKTKLYKRVSHAYPVKKTFKTFKIKYYKGKIFPCYPMLKRSDLHYVMIIEAQKNGYPHIHVLYLGLEFLFNSGNKTEYNNDNPHSKNLKHVWGKGSIFINRTKNGENIRSPIHYMFKYIRKTWTKPNFKSLLTQSMLWAFNINSFNTSKHLKEYLGLPPKNKNIPYSLWYKPKHLNLFFSLDYHIKINKTYKLQCLNVYSKLSGQSTPLIKIVDPLTKSGKLNILINFDFLKKYNLNDKINLPLNTNKIKSKPIKTNSTKYNYKDMLIKYGIGKLFNEFIPLYKLKSDPCEMPLLHSLDYINALNNVIDNISTNMTCGFFSMAIHYDLLFST